MTERGSRVEWNPTEDRWLPGTVMATSGSHVRVRLDEGGVLWVRSNNLRAVGD